MKLKFKAEAKDVMYFILFSIFLLFLIAVGVGNITSLSSTGEFVGFNPLPGLSSENIFGTLTLLEHYCKDFRDSEDISVIYPALKHTFIESDKLFAHFINTKYGQ